MKKVYGFAVCLGFVLLWCAGGVLAENKPDEFATLKNSLQRLAPDLKPDHISASTVPGLYEVVVGFKSFYMSADGRYLMEGKIIDLQNQDYVRSEKLAALRIEALEQIGEDKMIVFSPDKPRHTITVFTDTDCTFCQRLHSQMDEYNALGIKVRYLFYPLRSPLSKAVSVWCAKDPREAMTQAKAGKNVPEAECDNPIREHVLLGRRMELNGTPAIITENGDLIAGYMEPKRLIQVLERAGR